MESDSVNMNVLREEIDSNASDGTRRDGRTSGFGTKSKPETASQKRRAES